VIVEVRPATEDDSALAYDISEEAMRAYVEATWGGWDVSLQQRGHAESFTPSTHWIVHVDDQPAGVVAAELQPSHIQLVKLYLRAAARGRGVGSLILRALLRSAAARQQPLRLRVLAVNTRARAFYARHGLREAFRTAERVFMTTRQ
jgi:GNAT superfamily N-acetyltransferase